MKRYKILWFSNHGVKSEVSVSAADCFSAKEIAVKQYNISADAIFRISEESFPIVGSKNTIETERKVAIPSSL